MKPTSAGGATGEPLAIDLFAGLGGWAEGLLAEGYEVVGFDIERHEYGNHKYPAQLVLQDVLTIHGRQLKDAALIVASPPCQEFSYMAMPWSLAKEKARKIAADPQERKRLTALFDACFRIQREACEAAGRYIPMVVENVRGAQKWVGRAKWHYGSFYLWGDVPALMPFTTHTKMPKEINESIRQGKSPARWTNPGEHYFGKKPFGWNGCDELQEMWRESGLKQPGISGTRNNGKGDKWFQDGAAQHGSKSSARKAASAMIAKIPLPLARHIARVWKPEYRKAVSL